MKRESFEGVRAQVFALYGEKKYQDGLALSLKARKLFPQERQDTTFWAACFYSLLGETNGALHTLRSAVDAGLWWSPRSLLREPDLKALRRKREFKELVQACERLRVRAQRHVKPKLILYSPGAEGPQRRPLLITLHGRSSRGAKKHVGHWRAATSSGLFLAVPQSSRICSPGRFCWDDPKKARDEVARAFGKIAESHQIDPKRTILGGFSQGGGLAIAMALEGRPVAAKGFIGVAPVFQEVKSLLNLIRGAVSSNVKGYLITGDKDSFRPKVEQLHRGFIARGLPCELEVVPNLGHDYPSDFAAKLPAIVKFLLY